MTDKKFSSKKYGDYPIIIDNERNVELTLGSVVGILNDYEYMRKLDITEHNKLHERTDYVISQKRKLQSQIDHLILLLIVMVLIIIIETFLLLLGVV